MRVDQTGREIQTVRDNLPESRLTGANISIKLMWGNPHSNIISLAQRDKYSNIRTQMNIFNRDIIYSIWRDV